MAKSHMKEVAAIFGLELDEEFKVSNDDECTFKFAHCGLYINADDGWELDYTGTLDELLSGEAEVVKLPYEPEQGDWYYTYNQDWDTVQELWSGEFYDLAVWHVGATFRTDEEAIAARPGIYKALTGEDWE